jgi:hypothetical protein
MNIMRKQKPARENIPIVNSVVITCRVDAEIIASPLPYFCRDILGHNAATVPCSTLLESPQEEWLALAQAWELVVAVWLALMRGAEEVGWWQNGLLQPMRLHRLQSEFSHHHYHH